MPYVILDADGHVVDSAPTNELALQVIATRQRSTGRRHSCRPVSFPNADQARRAHMSAAAIEGFTTVDVFVTPRGTSLPLATLTCWCCNGELFSAADAAQVSRIGGDSKYGYEPCCKFCAVAIEAERVLWIEPAVARP